MLPAFDEIVEINGKFYAHVLSEMVIGKAPMFSNIKQHKIHEGRSSRIERADSSTSKTNFVEMSATTEIKKVRVSQLIEQIPEHLDKIAEQFAEQQSKNMIETISDAADSVGNVFDGKGKKLSPEMLLDVIRSLPASFDSEGKYEAPSMIVSPEFLKKLEARSAEFDTDEYQREFEKILNEKRQEHRRHEADRSLVG